MFQAPAFISCVLDSLCLFLYFQETWIFEESLDISAFRVFDLFGSDLQLIILAGKFFYRNYSTYFRFSKNVLGLRIFFFVPYIWLFQQDRRLYFAMIPYCWHIINILIISLKASYDLYERSWSMVEWLLLLASVLSVFCQVLEKQNNHDHI